MGTWTEAKHPRRADGRFGHGAGHAETWAKKTAGVDTADVPTRRPAWVERVSGQFPANADEGHPVHYPRVYHAAPAHAAAEIRQHGFHIGDGTGGAYFGRGVYFHVDKPAADRYLEGVRMYQYGDEEQIAASVRLSNPFIVHASDFDGDPGAVMHRALLDAGLIQRGQKLKPAAITRLLRENGYDGVEVVQRHFNDEIGGHQIVVFDPANITVRDS